MLTPQTFEKSIRAAEACGYYPHYAANLRAQYAATFPKEANAFALANQAPRATGRPTFVTVTGRAFGIANAAARARPNAVSAQIREHRQRIASANP